MQIRQHDNGNWYLHGYDGKRTRSISLRTKDRTEALRLAGDKINNIREAKTRNLTATIERILTGYLLDRRQKVASLDTLERNVARLQRGLGDLVPQELTPRVIHAYTASRKVKPGTMRRELGVLVAAMNWAAKRQIVPKEIVPLIELPEPSPARLLWCTIAQLDALLTTVEGYRGPGDRMSRVERFLWVAIETGARKSAIIELQWRSVDFHRGLIDFSNGKMGNTYKRRAMVPISNRLRPVLDRAFQERSPSTNSLVLDHLGCLRKPFARITTDAGLPWVTPNVLRHSWASNAAMAGVSFVEIARVLGNSVAMVEKRYSHFAPEYLRSAVNWRR